jgi:hypothetical protein
VIHRPEKVPEICIHNPLRPALDLFRFAQCVLRRSPSSISKAGIIEYRLEDGLQPIEQRLLTHAVIDRRYAEHSILSWFVPLRNRVPTTRSRRGLRADNETAKPLLHIGISEKRNFSQIEGRDQGHTRSVPIGKLV